MSIFSTVGGAATFSTASGGKMYNLNGINDTVPVMAAPANTARRKLTFHNPGDVDILVFPTTNASGAVMTPTPAARGGAFLVFANGGTLMVEGECQTQWNAISVSGSSKPLTVMDSNV